MAEESIISFGQPELTLTGYQMRNEPPPAGAPALPRALTFERWALPTLLLQICISLGCSVSNLKQNINLEPNNLDSDVKINLSCKLSGNFRGLFLNQWGSPQTNVEVNYVTCQISGLIKRPKVLKNYNKTFPI